MNWGEGGALMLNRFISGSVHLFVPIIEIDEKMQNLYQEI